MDYSYSTSGHQRPFWLKVTGPRFAALSQDLMADVCVIGGGIAGLSTAYQLQKAGLSVVVLEDGLIGSGETGRTTGHLSFALDERYTQLIKIHGLDKARLAAQSHMAAIDMIEAIVTQEQIDCDFMRLPGYLFADPSHDTDVLWQELEAAQNARVPDLGILIDNPQGTRHFGPSLKFTNQAQFHPMKYLFGLAKAFVDRGGRIFENTRAQNLVQKARYQVEVKTEQGALVTAQHAVIAANAPTFCGNLLDFKLEANRSYVIVAEIPKGSVPAALYWDRAEPYHYARIQNGDHHDLLIIGGEDHRTGHIEECAQHYEKLADWGAKHFAGFGAVVNTWSGQILEPNDYLGFIGRRAAMEDIYLVSGDSGHGLTHGSLAAQLICDLIQERDNPWAELYAPQRSALKPVTEFVKNNLDAASHYLDFLSTYTHDIRHLAVDQGALVQMGLQKLACYKDEQHEIHAFSAVCPHKKGLLKWNHVEKSWDCPMHGSRFSCHGRLLNGPAQSDLIPVTVEVPETV